MTQGGINRTFATLHNIQDTRNQVVRIRSPTQNLCEIISIQLFNCLADNDCHNYISVRIPQGPMVYLANYLEPASY